MRLVYKARIVPDTAPDSLTEKVIRVADLGVPVAAALGRWEALSNQELYELLRCVDYELESRGD